MTRSPFALTLTLMLAALAARSAPAQGGFSDFDSAPGAGLDASERGPELPESPLLWINSPPLSLESLRGKGVVVYFFEEECPVCARQWSSLQQLSTQYAEKPVCFLAVNSGTDPRAVRAYAQRNGVRWPIVADYDRSVEHGFGVTRVSLETVTYRVKFVDAEGKLHDGLADLPGTAEAALRGAKWRVDPKEIPGELRDAWRSVELGAFADAAPALRRIAKKEGPLKPAADRLLAAVDQELQRDFRLAGEAFSAEQPWKAYKLLDAMRERFKGYELPETVEPTLKKLETDPAVEAEVAARDTLRKAVSLASKGSPAARRRAKTQLERLVEESPDTEAARAARELIAQAERP